MGKVIEVIVDFILLIFSVSSLFGIIGAGNNSLAANNYMENTAAVISASNINPNVIEECKKEAEENGYVLEAEIHNPDVYSSKYATLTLTYDYDIPLLKVNTTHQKTKIAR